MEKIIDFITDDKTDRLFVSSLIDTPTGDLDVETRAKLKSSILKFEPQGELLNNTMDVWARDYMPIQLTEDVFLGYTYNPDYLADNPKCITNWQLHHVHTQKQMARNEHFEFQVVQMPIILDGGNVVKATVKGKPCMIMCDKVLQENNVSAEDFSDWWDNWWKDNFNGTEMKLVLLPWEKSVDDPFGHADGIVRFIEDGRVLMTNYQELDEVYGQQYKDILEAAGFHVETLTYLDKLSYEDDKTFRLLFKHSWCYINFLQVGHRILVPSLGYEPLDHEAINQIKKAFNAQQNQIDVQLIDVDMTAVVDYPSQHNSGGALNCLTWTIKSKGTAPS